MTTVPRSELTGDYVLDPAHTQIGFVARHAMVTKVRGGFKKFEGTAHLDGENPANSTVRVSIQADSIDTRNEQRDGHLRTNDFLDAPNHPEITFVSTSVREADNDRYDVTGDLTIKGVSKSLTIPFEFQGSAMDPMNNFRVGLEGSVTINRKEFGLTWNAALEGGGVLVGDKVVLEFEISAIRKS
ncbi:YceI family protein [Streptacidiphilus sp. MAP5-3]|uniref:YceI family protein n=1 Tax=unclassified Streptacidiphilus TaxID=2643834 RepID=UPI003513A94B